MTTNPLTAALLGLKIGLLLCCLCGCQPAPEPADDACVEDATPIAEPEQTVVVPMATKADVDSLRLGVDALSEQFVKVLGLEDRIITLLEKQAESNQCCMMPPAKPAAPAGDSRRPPASLVDAAEQRSIDDEQKLVFLLTKDGCSRCASANSQVITDQFFQAINGNLHFQEVNVTRHPEAIGRFGIPGGTLLPVALLWNPATQSFHEIQINPFGTTGDFLAELNLPQQSAAPARKRLLHLN